MDDLASPIPVILFAYSRPTHLGRALECLRNDKVPLVYAFSDGARAAEDEPAVAQVRSILRTADWCELVLCERESNLGLGRSILDGVTTVLSEHETAIVLEDDLVCVPGTYDYLCAALRHYERDQRVMSVTGWTHPLVTPSDVTDQPYFDGRAECLVWGTWARSWSGMQEDAWTLLHKCRARGIDVYRYGADLPGMAKTELTRNIWAVRFLYLHILHGGLCLRPPWSMVEHEGFDAAATNAGTESWIKNPPLRPSPPIPAEWPEPVENPACSGLHRRVCGTQPTARGRLRLSARRAASKALRIAGLR